jgi:hypothetical protein
MLIFSRLRAAFWGASDEVAAKPRLTFLESAITAGVGLYAFGGMVAPVLPVGSIAPLTLPSFNR